MSFFVPLPFHLVFLDFHNSLLYNFSREGKKMKILIVDDNKENLYLLEILLKGSNYDVVSAVNGDEALGKLRSEEFDMVISDIFMPVMDGFQLCLKVKGDDELKDIPFVFYTATYIDKKDEELAFKIGADKFIQKPIEPEEFVDIIEKTIKEAEEGKISQKDFALEEDKEIFELYSERIVNKLEQKMSKLEKEVVRRKKAEESLKVSEEKYRLLVENANEAIVVVQDEMLKFFNLKTMEIMGYSQEELSSMPFTEFIYPDDRGMVIERHLKRLKGEEVPEVYSFRIIDKDGNIKWVEINAVKVTWKGNSATLNFLSEITERKKAEEEKQKIQFQLLQAQKMEAIGTLAGGVAHDFNNQLTAIGGNVQLAMLELDELEPLYRYLRQINLAVNRSAQLTRQLLLFSRKETMEFETLSIKQTIDELLKMLNRLIGEDITIQTELQSDIWTIQGDAGNIEQVITNIVVNARDAMPQGGNITIETQNVILDKEDCKFISDAKPGKYVCLSIGDTGVGMDKETIKHIFEPFFSTKKAGKGTGLGLSVVYGIIKEHDGWINVYSEPEHGSTFRVYLPASSVKLENKAEETISLQDFSGNGERILLVEDEETVRLFTKEALSSNGYIVFEAAYAQEALDIFEREKGEFDLLFSDIVLPDKNALQLLDQILIRKPELPVLLCSGYTDKKSQWPLIQERKIPFIQKPFGLIELLKAFKSTLAS